MRIAIDLQCCQSGSRLGGIGRYSLELAKAMIRSSPQDEFVVVLNDRHPKATRDVRRELQNLVPPDAIQVFSTPQGCGHTGDIGSVRAGEILREAFLQTLNPDAVHVASLFEGFFEDIVTSVNQYVSDIPTAVTLYDLIPMKQQDVYLADPGARRHYFDKLEQLKRADVLLAISQYSADEGRSELGAFNGRIVNMRGGVDPRFKVSDEAETRIRPFLKSHGIDGEFLLYTASFDQRKNQRKLIEAYSMLPRSLRRGRPLVLVGNGWPAIYQELRAVAERQRLAEHDVVFTGRVSDDELVGLYNTCKLFIFPPLWEGLGMPALEAMACGAPVIGSNTTSVPEVLGRPDAEFDPTNAASIAAKMEQALSDRAFLADLKQHAVRHAAQFTWEASARVALDNIRQVHADRTTRTRSVEVRATEPGPASDKTPSAVDDLARIGRELERAKVPADKYWEVAGCLASNELETGSTAKWARRRRPKIGWVGTWGTRCGIAAYSGHMAGGFADGVHVLASYADDGDAGDRWPVTRCWRNAREDDLEELSRQIERLELTDIVVQFHFAFYDLDALNRLVERHVLAGRRVYITLHSTKDPPPEVSGGMEALRPALSLASVLFVHTGRDADRLKELGFNENVVQFTLPHYVDVTLEPPAERASQAEVIASYGFFLPGKGLVELIEALALIRADGRDVELLLVNAEYGDTGGLSSGLIREARARVEALGLTDKIRFESNFLSDEESVALLRTADLIAFPYQSTGEPTSASVRMGLAAGRPVATTPIHIFDDVAAEVFRLPGTTPQELADGLVDVLDALKADTAEARRIAANAAIWRRANAVRNASNYMRRVIERQAASEFWEEFLSPPLASLPLRAAVFDGKVIRSQSTGLLVHGPYVALPEGVYRLVIDGQASSADGTAAGWVEVTGNQGAKTHYRFDLHPGESALLDEVFWLPAVEQAEVLMHNHDGSTIALERYVISRRHAGA